MKFSIVIPVLNEVNTIEKVIGVANEFTQNGAEIIIADNGSTDGTLEKINVLKKKRNGLVKKLRVINVPLRGYGAALHYGILSAHHPFILFADADLSYDFSQIEKFIPLMEKNYDLILGSRLKGNIEKGAMPYLNRYLGTPILTFLIKLLYNINTSDCNSGMRVVKKSFYQKLNMRNSGMEWASELLIKTALIKGRFTEIPIDFHRDGRGYKPHLKRWTDGWRHLKVIVLLKPFIFINTSIVLFLFGLLSFSVSQFTTIAFLLLAEFLILCYLTTKVLEGAITQKNNRTTLLLNKLPLVAIGTLLTFIGFFSLIVISDNHLFTKYIILFQMVLYDLWLFFIETIKTHITNKLPE